MSGALYVCSQGCCPGCQFCYGYAIGCHEKPCKCGQPGRCPDCNRPIDEHRDDCPNWEDDSETLTQPRDT